MERFVPLIIILLEEDNEVLVLVQAVDNNYYR